MNCGRCGETREYYFYEGKCRRCIHLFQDKIEPSREIGLPNLHLGFELTDYQKTVSTQMVDLVNSGHSVYLNAVCGAGKTEMCLDLITSSLEAGLRIGWAIPRRQIVIELAERLSQYFPDLDVAVVYGGNVDKVYGDLIVCTTHQLFRYHTYFDVLIVDEPDAFPYYGNEMLVSIMKKSVRGPIVYLSATLDDVDEDVKSVSLDLRPSGKLLRLPQSTYHLWEVIRYLWLWRKEAVLIFVPTRKMARQLSLLLRCEYVSSDRLGKEEIVEAFRNRGGFLVCTTVLERGVTFVDCFVIVIRADHKVFSESTLVQIAGRVGRGMMPSKGGVVFWSRYFSQEVAKCTARIIRHNDAAQFVLNQSR